MSQRIYSTAEYCIRVRCTDCNHEQVVEPAAVSSVPEGVRAWYGSAADFCNQCDGPTETVNGPAHKDQV